MAHTLLEPRAEVVTTNYSQAFSLQPSRVWDGNDGAWSTFVIRVGSPPQYFRIVPSTLGAETWVPIPDKCDNGISWCGNARGVEPFNSGTSGPASGSPSGVKLGSLDAGNSCTANRSPNCVNCVSVNGRCTNGPCAGRTCCGDPPGQCNSGGCNGVSGICTGEYIGCPCPGPDFDIGTGGTQVSPSVGASGPLLAQGFGSNASSSWDSKGSHEVGLEKFLNTSANGQYGLDTVGIGAFANSGLTVESSVVAGVPTLPFYLGKLGLKPSNNTGPDKDTPSLMAKLMSQKMLPSLSYGYTAGALYKQKPPLGSLTFGGFDATRFIPNDMTFYIDDTNNLFLPIQSISAVQTLQSNSSLYSQNFTAIIDTTTPHTWLPLEACKAFEKAFGLKWDESNDLYLVNDTSHQRLLNQNPQVTFTLGPSPDRTINITLPYAAFDLQASQPFFEDGTNYFPIRRATNANQYTLGRAFFQEAYLLVDYETKNFSISQAAYPVPPESQIITINHHGLPAGPPTDPDPATPPLSSSTIAGITVGGAVGLIALAVLAYFIIRRLPICLSRQRPSLRTASSFFSSRPSLREKTDWPSNSQLHSPNSQGGTLIGVARDQSPTELKGCIPQELSTSNKSSPGLGFYGHGVSSRSNTARTDTSRGSSGGRKTGLSREESLSKPLPRTPAELMGSDPAAEFGIRSSTGSTGKRSRWQHLPNLSEDQRAEESPIDRDAFTRLRNERHEGDRLPRGKHTSSLAGNQEVDSPVLKGMGLGIANSTPEEQPADRHQNRESRGPRADVGFGSAATSRQASVRTARSGGKPTGLRSKTGSLNRHWQVSPSDEDDGRIVVGLGRSDTGVVSPASASTSARSEHGASPVSASGEDSVGALPEYNKRPSGGGRSRGRTGRGGIPVPTTTSNHHQHHHHHQPSQQHPPQVHTSQQHPSQVHPYQHAPRQQQYKPREPARERSRSRPRARPHDTGISRSLSRSRSKSKSRRKSTARAAATRNRSKSQSRSGSLSSARSVRSRATNASAGSADLRKVEWRGEGGFGRRSGSASRSSFAIGVSGESLRDRESPRMMDRERDRDREREGDRDRDRRGGGGGGHSRSGSEVEDTKRRIRHIYEMMA